MFYIILFAILYIAASFIFLYLTYHQFVKTKESFLMANRELGLLRGSFGIAAAWTWAVSLFVVPQIAMKFGVVGFFWVLIGNLLTLMLFGFAARRIRQLYPLGFTFSEHIRKMLGSTAAKVSILSFGLVTFSALALNLYAGSKLIATLASIDFLTASVVMSIVAIIISTSRGLITTSNGELFKIGMILIASIVLVPMALSVTDVGVLTQGLAGTANLSAWDIFIGTGIFFLLSHIAAPWADNSFWHRSFAIRQQDIFKSYLLSSVVFIIGPFLLGLLGFIAAGSGMVIDDLQLTNVAVLGTLLGPWSVVVISVVLMAAMISILDTQLTSFCSMVTNDILASTSLSESKQIDISRIAAVGLLGTVLLFINIPGMNIIYLALLVGAVRLTSFVPNVVATFKHQYIDGRTYWIACVSGIAVPLPIYVYTSFNNMNDYKLYSFLACLIVPAAVVAIRQLLPRRV